MTHVTSVLIRAGLHLQVAGRWDGPAQGVVGPCGTLDYRRCAPRVFFYFVSVILLGLMAVV